jgi:hypothetical protein
MKTMLPIALSLCLLGPFAGAAEGEKKPAPVPVPPPTPEVSRSRFLKKYDKNGDGKIDEAERTAMLQERRKEIEAREKERIKKYDKNGNGKLDDDERAAARDDFQKQGRSQSGNQDAPAKNPPPPPVERPPIKKFEKAGSK